MNMLYTSFHWVERKALSISLPALWVAVALGALLITPSAFGQGTEASQMARLETANEGPLSVKSADPLGGQHVESSLQPVSLAEGAAAPPSLRRTIAVQLSDATLEEAVEHIARRGNVNLAYLREAVASDRRVTLEEEQITVRNALRRVFQGEEAVQLLQSKSGHFLLRPAASQKASPSGNAEAHPDRQAVQTGTITGTVIEAETGGPLPGANVVVVGEQQGAATDADGNYTIEGVEAGTYSVRASSIGYVGTVQEVEVQADETATVNFELESEEIGLEEVVVVGYGTQRREDVTTAISQVSGADLAKRSARNITSSLQGVDGGVTVTDLGGEPGAANTNIRIRGVTTLGDNQPLFIVDGVEQSYNDIDPNNIESITVLKDASSTAIYGSRAANGVVMIETKRGSEEGLQVNYSGRVDFQNLATVPEHMDTEEYLRLQNLAYENRGSDPLYSEEEIDKYVSGENRLEYPAPNTWFDNVIQKNAPMMRHSVSVSGGGERVRSYGSLNYFDQQGVFPNRDATRYQLVLNNDISITEDIGVKADIRARRNDRFSTNSIGGGLYHRMTHGSQFTVPRYPDGTYDLSPQGHNPLAYADPDIAGGNEQKTSSVVGNIEGSWDIVEGLNVSSRFAVENEFYSQLQTYPTYEIRDYDNSSVVLQNRQINSVNENRYETLQLTWYNTVNYAFSVGGHNFDLLGGYSQERYDYKSVFASGRDLYNNELLDLGQTDSESRNIDSSYEDWGLVSFFSRWEYNFDQRYLIQLNARYDGSSRFPEGDRYTFFPSASLGWRISEESFWNPVRDIVNELKLRASWGETGNQNVGLYTYLDNLSVVQNAYAFSDNPQLGVTQNDVTSRNLTWETTTQTNVGVDLEFLNGAYRASFDWFKKDTEGILLTLPIAGVVGLNPAATNAGSVENTGWEFEVEHLNSVGEFDYTISLNVSDVRNEITDLSGTGPYFTAARNWQIRKEGEPIDAIWGYETDGFLSQEDIENGYPTYASDPHPGDIKYVDRNEDGVINSDDRKVLGSTIPRWEYGAGVDLAWRNWSANLQLQGVGKRDVAVVGAFAEGGSWEGFTPEVAGDYWTPDNPDARFPRPQKQTLKNQQPSDRWVLDGSYLRVKNVELSYSLPDALVEKAGAQSTRFFVGGTNLLTFSSLNEWGLDAEAPLGRGDYYPPVKTYTIGLEISM